ncbi:MULTISPECIES: hypothetical protein [unclassified Nonomuraea]|uniref:hypothetical protein n=1 Tax=unclassified Nonomuraea TaxID=2593643 RepID=UPI0033E110B8
MARAGRSYPNRPVVTRAANIFMVRVDGQGLALAVLAARSQRTGQVSGSGGSLPVAATKTLVIDQVTGTGVAAPVAATRTNRIGQVAGSGAATPAIRRKLRMTGQVAGTGLAFPVRSDPIANHVTGVGQARPVRAGKALAIHEATGIGQAKPLAYARGGPVGRVVSTGSALPLSATKQLMIGRVTGSGLVNVVIRRTPPLRVGLPMRSWSARFFGRGSGLDTMSSLSLEYLRFFVSNAVGSEPVEIAFTQPGVEPTEGQWAPASWGAVDRGGAEARIRVGPGGAVTLPDGTYQGWVRVTRPDERPVLPSGLVAIT